MLLKLDSFLDGASEISHDAFWDDRNLLARAGLDRIAKWVEELGLDALALQVVGDVGHAASRVDEAGQSNLLTINLHVLAEEVSLVVELTDDAIDVRTGWETLSDVFELAHAHMPSAVYNAFELSIHIAKLSHWQTVSFRDTSEVVDTEGSLAFEGSLNRVCHRLKLGLQHIVDL